MPSTIHSRLRRPGEFVDHLEERGRVHRGAAVWVDLEVEVGRAATGVAGVADEADDLTWLDQLAVVHALGEGAEVGVVVVRAALALDPDLGAAEHVAAHAGDDPPLTGQQRSARWGDRQRVV